ncbi:MAG: polysaccharide biosynthesis tyrosine autokinase, partial [Verrucomicrobiia bacterium]
AKMARLTAETEWKQVQAQLEAGQDPTRISAIASDEDVVALRQNLMQKQIAVSTLRQRYKDKYPAMAAALTEQAEMESRLKKACADAIEKIKAQYLMAKAKEEGLLQPLADQEMQAMELSKKLVAYSALKRNTDSDRQLYETLLTRMKEAGVAGKLEQNNLRIIDPALVPGGPCRPDKTKNLIQAIIMGLLAGLLLSYGAHIYDDKIKTYKDIESYLGMPLLCEVPRIEAKTIRGRATIVNDEPQSLAAEAFSSLRATMAASANAKDVKILMITSTAPGEGKSLVSSNISIAFAHDNLRTLLIDADMRRPSLHKSFELGTALGLSEYLGDGKKKDEVIQKSGISNLDIIIAGKVAKNPAELLGSARMRELIDEEIQRYDRIIIDTPPVAVVSDAIVLLPRVQGIVFVTHFRKLRRDAVARAVRKLREIGAPLIGNVLNNIDLKKHGYYYYPYHSSYHYAYYDHKNSGKRRRTESTEETV